MSSFQCRQGEIDATNTRCSALARLAAASFVFADKVKCICDCEMKNETAHG